MPHVVPNIEIKMAVLRDVEVRKLSITESAKAHNIKESTAKSFIWRYRKQGYLQSGNGRPSILSKDGVQRVQTLLASNNTLSREDLKDIVVSESRQTLLGKKRMWREAIHGGQEQQNEDIAVEQVKEPAFRTKNKYIRILASNYESENFF